MPTRGILERLSSGEFLVLDGATTTELEARGVSFPPPASSTLANIEAPDALKSLHADYLRVGADIITANNFSASPTALGAVGKGKLWKDYAAAGIKIALQVRDELNPEAYVAGGVHPAGNYGDEFRQRIQLLADEGVDLILAEAVNTVDGCLGVAKTCADIDLPLIGQQHIETIPQHERQCHEHCSQKCV